MRRSHMYQTEPFDAVVVGSGATGGWAAKKLTEAGMRVAVVEGGRKLQPEVDFTEHKLPFDTPLRNTMLPRARREAQPIQRLCGQCDELTSHLFVDDREHPYTTPADRPFHWIRSKHVGGKSITWGRQSYRLSDYDFKAASRDGYGVDWPISYADLAPYYDEVEAFVGISGMEEGLPQLPDSRFLPPMHLSCGEWLLRNTVKEKFSRTLTIGRVAILTQNHQGRAACHYCGPCGRGCTTGSYYSSPASTLPAAAATGRLTLLDNKLVSHITLDEAGKARGVWCVDRLSRNHSEVKGRIVLLCASTLESTRILLNSRSADWPAGLGNRSGVLGHYLMDHVFEGGASGVLPMLKGIPDPRGNRPNGFYIARFRNLQQRHPRFLRGYGFQGAAHSAGWGHAHSIPGFGATFKEAVKNTPPWYIGMTGFGECLAYEDNFCRIDDTRVDNWGIPVLHIDATFRDNERAMYQDMIDTATEMLEAVGAENIEQHRRMSTPGLAIHEVGTARMGNDPSSSFLNQWNQSHEVKNVFVTDGACYPSAACQNPTLTLMALTARACDYIVEQRRRGEI